MITINGPLLKAKIANEGISQNQLAARTGLNPGTISNVITGKGKPSHYFMSSVYVALDLDLEDASKIFFPKKLNGLV